MTGWILLAWWAAQKPDKPRVYLAPDKSVATLQAERMFQQACPQFPLTETRATAEVIVQLEQGKALWKRVQWTLASANGDVVASGADHELRNAVKDACAALDARSAN